jgi:predicted nucleotidyltransferase component of viral defense system
MFYNILDKKRKEILPLFKSFKRDFYLAGGTALALQIGHRDSIDFDFFTQKEINAKKLYKKIKEVFKDHRVLKNQEEKNTLTITIDDSIKVSFFTYKAKMINPLIEEDYLNLASLEDIACMKLSAITSRATNKDYIDIYFILQRKDLANLLNKTKKKLPDISLNLILKSLIFFKDIKIEPIKFKNKNKISFNRIKKFIKKRVSEIQTT